MSLRNLAPTEAKKLMDEGAVLVDIREPNEQARAKVPGARKPLELSRQVQLIAGTIALLGGILGYFVHPGFFAVSVFVGAGLFFAGSTGVCPMGKVLARAPWNKDLDPKNADSWA